MGTLTNGRTTKPFENPNAPGLDWRKSSRSELEPILPDCVVLAEAPDAKDHPSPNVPDGTRMIALTDDKDPEAPVLLFTRAEITKFFEGVIDGEFDEFRATDEELRAASEAAEEVVAA
ncbi:MULTISPECIES: DUF397 domain-containing protein [Streptomyces]|uniref:DUF397 domain-containing protein n=2 Tax=Streptomyces TaxID=1883 RepID=A0A1E7LQK7_9ACTN|nr:DUF397 domain-containing protein [Streptomyces nanshensis]OEV18183.1 hypothetical protein AN221_23890 [Streptomyces nanshensis]